MAYAGKIINGWVGVNLTQKEAESLVASWSRYADADLSALSQEEREQHRAAASAIIQISKAL